MEWIGEGKAHRLCEFGGQGEPSHHMPNGTALIAAYALRRLRLPFNVHVRALRPELAYAPMSRVMRMIGDDVVGSLALGSGPRH